MGEWGGGEADSSSNIYLTIYQNKIHFSFLSKKMPEKENFMKECHKKKRI